MNSNIGSCYRLDLIMAKTVNGQKINELYFTLNYQAWSCALNLINHLTLGL
ncbi:hypothetical protein THMIRHAM_16280 [Thiomicrorhabdus immobilis]|uniref:Uncharacterized protein n=1 Tax=Thiomicrorhabdus immobilis TaxID=2791037 RepID=A0ABM7MEK2_9GAMM|nr:hypothetical protein THMIRHAM_16280 [Thiomicrorhabdus immobilis]